MKILFVCKHNVGRSQMAEAFFNEMSKKNSSTSAGTHVEGDPDEHVEGFKKVRSAMAELGYDLSHIRRKQMTKGTFDEADKVVIITEKENAPDHVRNSDKTIFWQVDDGKGKSYEFVQKMRDQVKILVEKLVKELE